MIKNIRFTLDRNIKYSHYQSNFKINESYGVVEIKSLSDFDFDISYIFFPLADEYLILLQKLILK